MIHPPRRGMKKQPKSAKRHKIIQVDKTENGYYLVAVKQNRDISKMNKGNRYSK
jgi:hypothetical protein